MHANLFVSLAVSTTLLLASASAVVLLPGVISGSDNTQNIAIAWR